MTTLPLVDFLDDLKDPRVERARLHSRHGILVTTILAVIYGADSWTIVELFGRSQHVWLATCLALPHGIPSHDTYGRVFALLPPEALERGFSRWVQSLSSLLPGEVVAIDVKTACRSHDRGWAAEA
ncbi:MAG: ISAs1 family transposase [Caldilineaceae bacterium]|nr:ISAs1 family transposase [Caldilineaceae bacterium]